MTAAGGADDDALIDRLGEVATARARDRFLRSHRQLWSAAIVERLYGRVVRLARTDLRRAERLARAARWIADKVGDTVSIAHSVRAIGHVHHTRGEYEKALAHYKTARALFERAGRDVDVARTLNGALQSLISLGRYDDALASAAEARAIFERHGNRLGLARLDSNTGNILFRQDRFQNALALYQRAYEELLDCGEPQDLAAALSNLAVVYVSLNEFQQAVEMYRAARDHCERHDMPLLVLRADYNIADLHYLRGEYTRALDLYRAARAQSEQLGDVYHSALCDLDQSEIYLELNLSEEAAELAAAARDRFEQLGMTYEAARAVTNEALAASRLGEGAETHALFDHARALFAREGNRVRLALIDAYEALVLLRGGERRQARALARQALRQFTRAGLPRKAALCELLIARIDLQEGQLAAAERLCGAVLKRLADADAPALMHQAHCVLGFIRDARGERRPAYEAFQEAERSLEHLRSHVHAEDLKLAFLEDKFDVYERLVASSLALLDAGEQPHTVFGYIEKAKSRTLTDLLVVRPAPVAPDAGDAASEAVRQLQQTLRWHYRQIDEADDRTSRLPRRLDVLRERAHAVERELAKTLDELRRRNQPVSALESDTTFTLEDVQASLPPDTMLLEYYEAMGTLYVCLLSAARLEIVPVAPAAAVRVVHKLLQFQLAKFQLGPEYAASFAGALRAATEAHLRTLFDALIAPVRDRLTAANLIVVPHDVLHSVPFHALFDGRRYLIDDFTVAYAPSARAYRLCRSKPPGTASGALVMGVPDARAAHIADEVRAVAGVLPDARVFLGPDATAARLHEHGAGSRFVHIATHGFFRKDNPMFSSIRLGDGPLNVYDLYQLQLSSELVALSGCGTGLSVVVSGDEQLGLVRGLLYAGAHAVLLTLWDAHDRTTADFMEAFYGHLGEGITKAQAAQRAMRTVRDRAPHPFYWAPFTLIGNAH